MPQRDVKVLFVKYGGRITAKGFEWQMVAKHVAAGIYRVTLERGEKADAEIEADPNLPKYERDIMAISEAVRG